MSNKVPQIRFNGYSDDWEERKLGDISKVIDPHPSHRAPAATEEGIPFIGIGDVNEIGNINYKTARIVDAKIFDEHHNRYDLSIPSIGIGRVASLGKVIRLRDDIGKYVVSPTMSVIQFTNNNDLDFLYSNMNTPIFQKQFKSFSNGSTRQSVGIQDLRILMVSLPVDIEEQQKIGSFFKQLDDTIALHQRKLDLLKEQKKGYLQKMFPKNGAKVPELRFAGFADDWEERKLADVVSISAGGDVDKTKLIEDGGYPVLANALTNSGIVGYYDSYKVEAPAVTVTGRGDVGHAVARHVNFTPVVRLLSLKSEVLDADFLANMLNQTNILIESTGVPQLTAPQLGSYKILYPNLNEQTKIGKLLNAFDNLIALHQRKLELLKEQKKGFLQKMFV
ncbi:restriction endonuclease subunit S (plasmid) [Latilactobacillus sakei]